MSGQRKKATGELASLYSRFVERQSEEWRARCAYVCRERSRCLDQLNKRGVRSIADLLRRFPQLAPSLKHRGIDLICLLRIRRAIPVLLELMLHEKSDRGLRVACADALYRLRAGNKVTKIFVDIGNRELGSSNPDRHWLEAVILGLGNPDDPAAVELLVKIFERSDLPGWLRGDAADKLGCVGLVHDRRRTLFHRCRETALRGLTDDSIEVQFWSMYLISQLCSGWASRQRLKFKDFESALPKLRRIALNDHRLSPGFWWPMSAEAEDTIGSITGQRPDLEAAERWPGNTARGESNRN